MLDLVIIGGAAVGCSSAIYAARRKLNFRMITENVGGEVALSGQVNNWPGIIDIEGYDLAQKFAEHARSYGVNIEEGWRVTAIEPVKNYHIIKAEKANGEKLEIETKAVIIGTGIHPRRLGVRGEDKLDRKGITYCTVCDGPLYRNKITATIGAGNSALESALMMSGIAKEVYMLSKYPKTANGGFPKGDKILVDKLEMTTNVKFLYEVSTTEIAGENKVTGLHYTDKGKNSQEIILDAVMVHIGMIPNSMFVKGVVELDAQGQIIIDAKCRTNVPGIFAAGDVTNVPYKQIGIAAGQGIVAALAAIEYINLWE
jgi:NADH-dependent peroxiredoxin subunit F